MPATRSRCTRRASGRARRPGPRPSSVGSPAPAVQQPSETPPVEVSGTGEPSAAPIAAACAASAATAGVRSSGGVTSRSSPAVNVDAAVLVAAQQLRLGPVEVGLVPAAHVDRRARLAGDRVEHVAAVHARDVQREPLAGAVERGDARELARQREHGVAAVLGLRSRVRRASARDDVEPAAALARGDDRAARPAALHAQDGVEAREPRLRRDRLGAHLLVGHGHELEPRERARRRRPAAARRAPRPRSRPSCPPCPGPSSRSPSRRSGRRATRAEREHGVVVAEQRDARPARRPRAPRARAGRPARARARWPGRSPRASVRARRRARSSSGVRAARRFVRDPAGDVAEDQLEIRRGGVVHVPGGRDRVGHRAHPASARDPGCAWAASRSRRRAR